MVNALLTVVALATNALMADAQDFVKNLGLHPVPRLTAKLARTRTDSSSASAVNAKPQSSPASINIVTGDPNFYRLNETGRLERVVPDFAVDKQLVLTITAPLTAAMARHDLGQASREVMAIPLRIRDRTMNEVTLTAFEEFYYASGVKIADERGDYRELLRWSTAYLAGGSSPQVIAQQMTALIRLGYTDENTRRYLEEGRHQLNFLPFDDLVRQGAKLSDATLAELIAARSQAYGASETLGRIHAERALALDPNQAASAIILMPIYDRNHRYAEEIRVGEAALPSARGTALDIIQSHLSALRSWLRPHQVAAGSTVGSAVGH